ncbi:hypothetical protein M9H77_08485 [Catharanthus roseus]|uniref:Uncharacterized protein n=1 Tax=Catharanthus roseus TaxID=4058 RepID=A0ACC0BY31_CATRO|nr:hypothetical protein M9H77_08485 [Catharanthus roseus]
MHRNNAPYRSVRGLHCTWLVPRTRATSNGVDVSDSGEWIHLKRGVDCRGCGPMGLRGHRIMLCGGIQPPSRESGGARHRGWSQGRPSRNHHNAHTHVDSLSVHAYIQYTDEVLGVEFWFKSSGRTLPRGTQIPYSAAVELMAGLGVSHRELYSVLLWGRNVVNVDIYYYVVPFCCV